MKSRRGGQGHCHVISVLLDWSSGKWWTGPQRWWTYNMREFLDICLIKDSCSYTQLINKSIQAHTFRLYYHFPCLNVGTSRLPCFCNRSVYLSTLLTWILRTKKKKHNSVVYKLNTAIAIALSFHLSDTIVVLKVFSYQIVYGGTLLIPPHEAEKSMISHYQHFASVLIWIRTCPLSLLSMEMFYQRIHHLLINKNK